MVQLQESPQDPRDSPGDVLRPIRRRSSILPRVNSDPLEFNDDSVERNRVRHESAASSPANSSTSRRSLNLGAISQFTTPQIAAGIAECIKLNTENKITKKNAFSLKLIDFMTYMIKNRDENMSNLQVASTTLDVSAKIYGLRVDVLHQETMDIVGNLHHERQNGPDDAVNDNEASADHNHTRTKTKKKKRVIQVLTDPATLCCDPEIIKLEPPMLGDSDFQTSDMLLQVTAPRHVGLGLEIHPYNDQILDKRAPETEEISEKIPWNFINIPEDINIGVIFKDYEFLNWDSEYDPNNSVPNWTQQNTSVHEEPCQYDLNGSYTEDDDNGIFHQEFDDHMNNDEDGHEVTVRGFGNQRGREAIADIRDIIEHAPAANDYSFFEEKSAVDIRWKSSTQWTVKNPSKPVAHSVVEGQRREPVRRKKNIVYDTDEDIDDDLEGKFEPMKKVKRKIKTCAEKVTRPVESGIDLMELFKYATRKDDDDLMPKKRGRGDGGGQRESGENGEDFRMDIQAFDGSMNHEDGGGGDHDMSDDHVGDAPGYDGTGHDGDGEGFGTQGGFIGDNLVEAPKLTEKIYIQFSQRAKKLDMRHLKKCIWKSINGESEDKENEEDNGEGVENEEKENRTKGFAEIYEELPGKLNKNDAKELSFAIAFVSLLHLANEKNLELKFNGDFSDIIIVQEAEG